MLLGLSCSRWGIILLAFVAGCSVPSGSGADATVPGQSPSAHDSGSPEQTDDAGNEDAGALPEVDGGDAGRDAGPPCGCTPPAECNWAHNACTFQCIDCSDAIPCPEGGRCRDPRSNFFVGFCVYPNAPGCFGGPVPTSVVLDVVTDGCSHAASPLSCHRRHQVDFEAGTVTISLVVQEISGGNPTEKFRHTVAASASLVDAWVAAAEGGLWCTSVDVDAELCMTHVPFVAVEVGAADAGHHFEYAMGLGARPPPSVLEALDDLYAVGLPYWQDAGEQVVWP